jgi:hypothetical protein
VLERVDLAAPDITHFADYSTGAGCNPAPKCTNPHPKMSTHIPGPAAAVAIIGAIVVVVVGLNQGEKDTQRRVAERQAANRADNATVVKTLGGRARKNTELAKNGKVRPGMIGEQCRMAWGKPDRVNRTTDARGVHEQWIYPDGNYLFLDNDVLRSISQPDED